MSRPRSIDLMFQGKALLKSGDLDAAEKVLSRAVSPIESEGEGVRSGAHLLLGKVLEERGDLNGALIQYERALSDRECAKRAISIHRKYAKEAAGHAEGALRQFNRMLWISYVYQWSTLVRQKYSHDPEVCEVAIKTFLREVRERSITYAEVGANPDDKLLTKADYRKMHKLSFPNEKGEA